MRLDRFITLNVARPLHSVMACLSPSPRRGEGAVLPVLMYHSISRHDESHVGDYYKLCTPPDRFRLQMETLKEHGFTATDLETGLEHLRKSAHEPQRAAGILPAVGGGIVEASQELGAPVSDPARFENQVTAGRDPGAPVAADGNRTLPELGTRSTLNSQPSTLNPRPVVLTFDDGSRDFHTEALPVLAEFGFTATMFLPTAFIGENRRLFAPSGRSHSSTLNHALSTKSECMTWPEVRECRKFGIRFGSHTVSHPKLYDLSWPDIESEVQDSRSDIEAHLGEQVASFAYPYAFPQADQKFCARFRETLVASGYQSCVTTIAGRVAKGDDPFALRRLPVNGKDDPALLLAKVNGSYDWVAPAQLAAKRFKGMLNNRPRRSALNDSKPLQK